MLLICISLMYFVECLFVCLLVIHISLVKYSNLVSLLNFKSSLHTIFFSFFKKKLAALGFICGMFLYVACVYSFLTRD